MSDREQFLAGERPDDVAFFLHEAAVSGIGALAEQGERTAEGVVLVVDGEAGQQAFQSATGIDPMAFAREAMGTEGRVDRDLTGGTCPDSEGDGGDREGHQARLIFAFAEAQNEDVEGLYAEGDVVHAYVACECGQRYSEKWLTGE
jgi:NADPH-dependent ferric siderophore reductase